MIAVMEERDREIARRTKHAWMRPAHPANRSRSRHPRPRTRGRLSAAFARSLAFFG